VILLVEKNLYVGDVVKINDMGGTIEKLSVRFIQLRSVDGAVHTIPYSLVNSITNYSKDYSRHFDTLCLCSIDDLDKAKKILCDVINSMKKEDDYKGDILEDVVIHGISPFDSSGVKIYWEIKTATGREFVMFEIYDRLVKKLKKSNVAIPLTGCIRIINDDAS
jgi:small conductance mechanosensitive channel